MSRLLNSKWYSPLPDLEIQELAQELTGVAFGKAFADIASFDESKSALPSWVVWKGRSALKGIVLKEIREAARRARAGTLDVTEQGFVGEDASGTHPDPSEEAVHRLSMAESGAQVRSILASMLPSQRQALTVAYLGAPSGSSAVEVVAITMGIGRAAAESLLRRAVQEFRRRWEEQPDQSMSAE
jgi:DNA-directed RNA polymerase specialized sigma24 family protein